MKDDDLDAALKDWGAHRTGAPVTEDEAFALVDRAARGDRPAQAAQSPLLRATPWVVLAGAAALAAAALLVLGGAGLLAWSWTAAPPDPDLPPQVVSGPEPLPVDVVLTEGDARTGRFLELVGEGALVAAVREDRLGLGPNSTVELAGTPDDLAVLLEKGSVAVRAAPRVDDGSLVVRAGAVTVAVIGTRFSVDRVEGGVRVDVAEGRVSVARTGQSWTVDAGQALFLPTDAPSEPTQEEADTARVDGLLRLEPAHQAPADIPPAAPSGPTWDLDAARQAVGANDPTVRALLEARVHQAPTDHQAWALLATVLQRADETQAAIDAWGLAAGHAPPADAARHRFQQARLVEPTDPGTAAALYARVVEGEAGALLPDALLGQARALKATGDPRWEAVRDTLVADHPASAAARKAASLE